VTDGGSQCLSTGYTHQHATLQSGRDNPVSALMRRLLSHGHEQTAIVIRESLKNTTTSCQMQRILSTGRRQDNSAGDWRDDSIHSSIYISNSIDVSV